MNYRPAWQSLFLEGNGKGNLRSGSIFVSLRNLHSGGQGETKREPDTTNVNEFGSGPVSELAVRENV